MSGGPKPHALEQARRDLIQAKRPLYEYVAALEQAKAFDSAGDLASGSDDGMATANRLWGLSAAATEKAKRLGGGANG